MPHLTLEIPKILNMTGGLVITHYSIRRVKCFRIQAATSNNPVENLLSNHVHQRSNLKSRGSCKTSTMINSNEDATLIFQANLQVSRELLVITCFYRARLLLVQVKMKFGFAFHSQILRYPTFCNWLHLKSLIKP